MGALRGRVAARRVAEVEEAAERGVEVAGPEEQAVAVAVVDPPHPRTGEAVGLLLEVDRVTADLGLVLDRVAPLVGERERDGEVAPLLVEVGEQVLVVVGEELPPVQ